ncbi:hypothetical protein CANMA_002052 [Candida margitis]|uniref:uncharacterized protein n=1 Tax=Candida margitis TaxID=1775924 RepID=UPI0022266815|nr:uncharacterized protein CANMA_002052 [Candida margitis]KAI5968878.1 hypothetical protein CANMA_002052 [Candida margitis]
MNREDLVTALLAATKTLEERDDETGMPSLSSSTDSYTTPSVSVPPNNNNPFIIRQHNPSGTVFIAVGAIVGAILLGFIFYHLILSLTASRVAKKTSTNDRILYEKYESNNNNAYGYSNMTPTSTLNNFEYKSHHHGSSISKLPLLNRSFGNLAGGSQAGDNSTIYQSDVAVPAAKHDLTKMFISPTAEVMQHKRNKSYNPSLTNLPFGGSASNLASPSPATNRHSQLVPSLYINNEINNSDYSIAQHNASNQQSLHEDSQNHPQLSEQQQQSSTTRTPRKTIPSMYLEDLID